MSEHKKPAAGEQDPRRATDRKDRPMPRLARPAEEGAQTQRIARELLAAQAEVRARAAHNGYFARLAYDAGIPVAEIAQTYSITLDSAYKLIRRVPDCYNQHDGGEACTECGQVGAA